MYNLSMGRSEDEVRGLVKGDRIVEFGSDFSGYFLMLLGKRKWKVGSNHVANRANAVKAFEVAKETCKECPMYEHCVPGIKVVTEGEIIPIHIAELSGNDVLDPWCELPASMILNSVRGFLKKRAMSV